MTKDYAEFCYDFHHLFTVSSNTRYFEGLFHSFHTDKTPKSTFEFVLDNNLKISNSNKPRINLMLYYNTDDDSIEFNYPWIRPIQAKLSVEDDFSKVRFVFNKNYLRFSNILAEGWELIDLFRSSLQIHLVKNGMHMIHAAAVRLGDEGVLIPSFGNTGKTTAAWMLGKRGAEFLTDEFAIIDSENNCWSFPCSSLMSKGLVKSAGIKLDIKRKLSLSLNEFRSRIFSTRFAPGGIKLDPDKTLKTRDKARVTRLVFIQKGLESMTEISDADALTRLAAVQDYELNWRSNPFVIAWSFFCPKFVPARISSTQQKMHEKLAGSVRSSVLVSSPNGQQFRLIERIPEITSTESVYSPPNPLGRLASLAE